MYRVYIDEAGDRGHRPGSSKHFVVSAVIVADEADAKAREQLTALRAALGRHPGHVPHLTRFPAEKLHEYRRILERSDEKIRWACFAGHQFRFNSPNAIELLQVADIAASAVFRAVEPDDFGNLEPRYLRELAPALYRRGMANITSYGLKVFPSEEARKGGSLDFLRTL